MQQQLAQQSQYKRQSTQANSQILPKSKASTPLVQPLRSAPQAAAVGGRVASSQLALLESRGLSAIPQAATNASTVSSVVFGDAVTSDSSTTSLRQMNVQSNSNSAFSNKGNMISNDNK